MFYPDNYAIIAIDYLVEHKEIEENKFAYDYNLRDGKIIKAGDVTLALQKLGKDQILVKKSIRKEKVDAKVREGVSSQTQFVSWSFHPDLLNVLKYRISEIEEKINTTITNAKKVRYTCPGCKHKFEQAQLYKL